MANPFAEALSAQLVANMDPMNQLVRAQMGIMGKGADLQYDKEADEFVAHLETRLAKAIESGADEVVIAGLRKRIAKYAA